MPGWMVSDGSEKKCQIWNGSGTAVEGPELQTGHITGKLGVYNGRPTAIGGQFLSRRNSVYIFNRAVESLSENGEWFTVARLPM